MTPRALSRMPFDPREVRVVAGLAKWMNLLGRLQILASVFVVVVLLVALGLFSSADAIDPAGVSAGDAPLVSVGEVSQASVVGVLAAVFLVCVAFFRGGMLLISGAEDLEAAAYVDDLAQHHLEQAIGRIRSYFVIESWLMLGVVVLVYAATIAWGA